MAKNGLTYEGRLVNTEKSPIEFGKFSEAGQTVMKITVAEQHSAKNSKAAPKYQDKSKAADAYVQTTTTWHKITLFGEEAEALAQDPEFNNGAILDITNVQYTEEDPWKHRDGTMHAGRPETAGRDSSIKIHEYNGKRFGAYTDDNDNLPDPIWDGIDDIPIIKGKGGGNRGGSVNEDDAP